LTFYQNVSPTKELRDSSNEAESLVRDFSVESDMRIDVFNSKIAAEKNIKDSGKWDTLLPEEQRLVEKMVRVCLHVICFSELRSVADIGRHSRWPCSARGTAE
jgi:hypothetical protein